VAVKIRLKKLGRTHRPFFRVCAMDTRTRRDGREIEILGTYDPMVKETDARAILKGERIDYWLGVGAQASPKVGTLIKKYGTGGSHLAAQQAALEKLGSKRASSIAAAVKEAETTKVELKTEEEAAPEAAEGAEATAAEATAAEAPAAEATPAESTEAAETTDAATSESSEAKPAE
jgi:small subunit ribosomal protein S16